MPWLDKVPAVIEAWYPGQRGGEALARLLFGEADFAGRLPMTFPASEAQLPRPHPVTPTPGAGPDAASNAGSGDASALEPFPVAYREGADVGYRWYAAQHLKPLFPFGYGLTYTHFAYSNAHIAGGATPSATVTVRNDGDRAGIALPQLYAATGGDAKRLVGWSRIELAPNESKTVTVSLDPRAIATWRDGAWVLPGGAYQLTLGTDAATAIAAATVTLPQQVNKNSPQ